MKQQIDQQTDKTDWFIYILRCADNTLYTGVTTNLQRRLKEHNSAAGGARYTRARRPVQMVYAEPASNRSTACRREYELKQLNRTAKECLIASPPPFHLNFNDIV